MGNNPNRRGKKLCATPQKVVRYATMSVYDGGSHRTSGSVNPPLAAVEETFGLFSIMLTKLQENGVKLGSQLRIEISCVRPAK